MMKIHFCLLIVFALLSFFGKAQLDTTVAWQQTYGGSNPSYSSSVKPTKDGGYIVAGSTTANDGNVSGNHGVSDVWLVKLDAYGNLLWQKCLGGSASEAAQAVEQTADGGFIIGATTASNDGQVSGNHGGQDVWIVKTDSTGAIQWQKCFGGSGSDQANSLQVTPDKGYIFTALTYSTDGDVLGGSGMSNCWIVKLDSLGNILWQKTPVGVTAYLASFIQNTTDTGFIVTASVDSSFIPGFHGNLDCWVAKLDRLGNLQWQKSLGSSAADGGFCVQQAAGKNGGFIVAAYTKGNDGDAIGDSLPNLEVPWMVKLDDMGNITWQKKITAVRNEYLQPFPSWVTVDQNGNYIVCGHVNAFETAGLGWIARLDTAGNIIDTATTDKGISYQGISLSEIELTGDGGFVATGDSYTPVSIIDSTYVAGMFVIKYGPKALPVPLLSFTATKNKNAVLAQWQTATEANMAYYNVQRSVDAVHFTTVGKVTAAGKPQTYIYTDDVATLLSTYSTFFYRLQAVDKNGNITVSNVARVIFPGAQVSMNALPNPTHSMLAVTINNYSGNVAVAVYDMAGHRLQQVSQYANSANPVNINTSRLAAGTYIIATTINGVRLQQKFVKQ